MDPDEEDDRTVIRPRTTAGRTPPSSEPPTTPPTERIARPEVPATVATSQHTLSLPNGTRLAEFELTETLGEGGFGIVYLAWDRSLDRRVAIKEYMPSAIATRVGQTDIRPRSERHQETFEAGLKSFINEAKLLAQFDHPALVKVYRFWEANGTAYMVMPFYEGVTLRDVVRGLPQPPDEAWILTLLEPLFHALSMLHAAQCFHRDIAPDNILLLAENGRPLLLDFGAARRVIGDMTQALTAILKPGYAPIEQYAEVPGLKQGAWTDVYALAAVVHWMIAGKTPPASVGRMFGDSHVPLAEKLAGKYSAQFLQAIDRALAVLPVNRTQTIEALRQDMTGAAPLPAVPAQPPVAAVSGPATPPPRTLGPVTAPRSGQPAPASEIPAPAPTRAASAGGTGARRWLIPALIAGVVGVAAATAIVLSRRPATGVDGAAAAKPVLPGATGAVPSGDGRPAGSMASTAGQSLPAQPPPAQPMPAQPSPAQAGPAPVETAVLPAPRPAEASASSAAAPAALTNPPPARPDPEPAVRRPVPPKPERRAEPVPVEPRVTSDNTAECARLFQRLSIGESHPEIIERVKALRCR